MPKIEMGKKYQTRGRREVRIYAVDGGGGLNQVHGAYREATGWAPCHWSEDGRTQIQAWGCDAYDLIEVPVEHRLWVNVLRHGSGFFLNPFASRAEAEACAGRVSSAYPRIACIEIVFHEGDGLEGK